MPPGRSDLGRDRSQGRVRARLPRHGVAGPTRFHGGVPRRPQRRGAGLHGRVGHQQFGSARGVLRPAGLPATLRRRRACPGRRDEERPEPERHDGLVVGLPLLPERHAGDRRVPAGHAALREQVVKGTCSALGWVSAKLLQRAATGLPDPPTPEAILRGLWTLRDETLGGLTHPLTFVQDQNAPKRTCWFNLQIADRAWRSPDQNQLHCLCSG